MSQSVQDVLSAITVASEALTREPTLRSQISTLEHQLDSTQRHGQELELKIIDYKSTIDALNDKVRSLEVERDQAQFRTLELEEAYTHLAAAINQLGSVADAAHDKFNPPKPLPEPEPVTGYSVTNPSTYTGSTTSESVGHSESPPSASTQTTGESQSATSAHQETADATRTEPAPFVGKYTGKKWSEVPTYERTYLISEWKAHGGTDENWNA